MLASDSQIIVMRYHETNSVQDMNRRPRTHFSSRPAVVLRCGHWYKTPSVDKTSTAAVTSFITSLAVAESIFPPIFSGR
tara:strand:- start:39 stop:275 length:237 start_codon:yes stop_codon:yes gene_type:complete